MMTSVAVKHGKAPVTACSSSEEVTSNPIILLMQQQVMHSISVLTLQAAGRVCNRYITSSSHPESGTSRVPQ